MGSNGKERTGCNKLKRQRSSLLISILVLLMIFGMSLSVYAEEDNVQEKYLSDLEWVSATHGDAMSSKSVQKDHPFTPGNNGESTKISLKMEDGSICVFDKGLGTVAAYPSTITYDITGAGVTRFFTYLGLDRTSNNQDEQHAFVEKIEVVVDGTILYTTLEDHPEGIQYDTPAIKVDLEIPDNARTFELKSYAGEKTWGDEVVYADAKFTMPASEPEPEDPERAYLSDLEWVSATHGDAMSSKTVQKDHPFTPGNNGESTKISLKMEDGSIRVFDKGLGTVAAYPSTITYDITGAEVTRFFTYLGLDRTANNQDEQHAFVEKIEVVVDGTILYTTLEDHPEGIQYDTPAIEVDLEIPQGAKRFQLKSYAGEKTWADEVVYADAQFKASGSFPNPNEWVPAPKRREISNEKPLMIIPLYANGPLYEQNGEYGFWGDDTLVGKWQSVPDDLKPYTVIELHPDDLPKREGSAADFYEHFLQLAQNYQNPETGENEPIPIVLTVFTAGNVSGYTAAHWLTLDWIEEMYLKYDCLQGIFSTENYWVWTSGLESMAAQYLELSAKYGGYFIWAEQNNGASIEKALGSAGQNKFREALENYWENFIFMYKNTPAAEGNDAPTSSYMTGLWLTDYAYQWGGLMDTWKWYETGKWKLFGSGSIGKSQGNRQWLTEPEGLVGIEAMMIYLNGGCVYNFEHPAYTYGVRDLQSPLYTNVIQEFFRYIIDHPAPSKSELLSKTKTLIHGNFSQMGNGNFFVGLNIEMAQTPTYTTGRYGNIPAVPSVISRSILDERLADTGIEILEQGDEVLSNLQSKKMYFDGVYPKEYDGDIFAQKLDGRWFVYNYKYNENVFQSSQNMTFSEVDGGDGWTAGVTMEPHTSLILERKESGVNVRLNNYRTNKDELWNSSETAAQARVLPEFSKTDALNWVYTNYINNTQDEIMRTTTITLAGLSGEPVIENLVGLDGNYQVPTVVYDAQNGSAEISITCNGYVYFDITVK